MITTTNPATGEKIAEYPVMSEQDALSAIEATHSAFITWRQTDFSFRSERMRAVADILDQRKQELASLMMREMGKPHAQGVAEIEKCATACRYYAENAEGFLADEEIDLDGARGLVCYQPLGVVLAVMPWNYPFWQVFRFAAPTLMAGNAALLRHASSVSGCALEIERLFLDAGFPRGLFTSLLVEKDTVAVLIADRNVRAVTLTGSTGAGRTIAAEAGKNLKKTVLELGGSDPYLILEDCELELDKVVKCCAEARLQNAGQSCIAAKRFIVVDGVYERFLKLLEKEFADTLWGDPAEPQNDMGPMASEKLRDDLHDQVCRSVKAGARCVIGGEIPDKAGAWYPPTILADVSRGMTAYDEELFGPVAIVIRARDLEEAVCIANSSDFGLGGGVFTSNEGEGKRIARELIDSGSVAVNGYVKSDPRMPFGGVKDSGYGRELSSFGIREFVNVKALTIGTL